MFRNRSNYGIPCREIRNYPKVQPTYGYDTDDTGRKIRVKNGTTNVYQQIQEATPETQIYNLIDRINRTGDMSLLGEAVEGVFDATVYPSDMFEAQRVRVKAEQIFAALPFEERRKYNNDVYKYIESVNTQLKANTLKAAEKKRAAVVNNEPAEGDSNGNKS